MNRIIRASALVCLLAGLAGCAHPHGAGVQSHPGMQAAPPILAGGQTERLPLHANLHIVARHPDGVIFADRWVHNLRTTGGADWQSNAMAGTSQPAVGAYISLSNDATAPAAGDCPAGSTTCTLTGEITTNGLARALATYAHSNGTNSYTLTKTFTATGTQASQKAAVFNCSSPTACAGSGGTMIFEATYVQVSLINGDTVTVQWTVSV